ncbi:hypothetical protein O181_124011, partial [Austropuccinia psidii MF-1]|nr:hypothetical protein [Austropuccinia psidii MF-1]
MVVANQPGAKLGPIGQLAPLGVLWHPCHNTFPWPFYGLNHLLWPQAISCRHWPSLLIPNSPTPRPGGSFCLLGASRPPSHHLWIQGPPFINGFFGLNGLLGHLGPLRLLRHVGRDSRSM